MSSNGQRFPLDDIANLLSESRSGEIPAIVEKEGEDILELRKVLGKFTRDELLNEIKDIIGTPTFSKRVFKNQLIDLLVKQVRSDKSVEVYVHNLRRPVNIHGLRELFQEYGKVRMCYAEHGVGVLVMAPVEAAREAVEALNNTSFSGKTMRVEMSMGIFVYNLPKDITNNDLAALFKEYGDVKFSDVARSYGYVVMASAEVASVAMEALDGTSYNGCRLALEKEMKKDVNTCINALELRYCQLRPQMRQWTAMEILNPSAVVDEGTSPERFQRKFEKCLRKSRINCDVISRFHQNQLWSMMTIHTKKNKPERTFVLCFLNLPVIVYSFLKAQYQIDLQRALVDVFSGQGKDVFLIKSKNVNNLLKHCCDKASIEENVPEVPVKPVVEKRPRKGEPEEEMEDEDYPNIISADQEEEAKRKAYAKNVFPQRPAAMDKLTYDVYSDFYGLTSMQSGIPVTCKATFKGQNITEGIKQLVQLGIMEYPVRNYVREMPKAYCDSFRLKIRTAEGSES